MKEYMVKIKNYDHSWRMEFYDEYDDAKSRIRELEHRVSCAFIYGLYNGKYYWEVSLDDDDFFDESAEHDVCIDGIWYHFSGRSIGYKPYDMTRLTIDERGF